jgi:hypothetical protein
VTEQEWLACTDPGPMVEFLQRQETTCRKRRLFACASCRRIWHLLVDDRSRRAVETVERWSDGFATDDELKKAFDEAGNVSLAMSEAARSAGLHLTPEWSASVAVWDAAASIEEEGRWLTCNQSVPLCVSSNVVDAEWSQIRESDIENTLIAHGDRPRLAQSALVREIFGNPFHQITIDLSLLTPAVVKLAQAIYDKRAFDRLPILADVLHDAGCDNDDILGHCRGPGPHVRGCWALDLVLGKE